MNYHKAGTNPPGLVSEKPKPVVHPRNHGVNASSVSDAYSNHSSYGRGMPVEEPYSHSSSALGNNNNLAKERIERLKNNVAASPLKMNHKNIITSQAQPYGGIGDQNSGRSSNIYSSSSNKQYQPSAQNKASSYDALGSLDNVEIRSPLLNGGKAGRIVSGLEN